MTKEEVRQRINDVGIVPVIRATCTDFAVTAGQAYRRQKVASGSLSD